MTLEQHIQELEALVSRLMAENAVLKAENATLTARIARLEVPRKDSSNSSIPPSQDVFRPKRTESLRKKAGKKPGGQPSHEGTTLQLSATPAETIHHQPELCTVCGKYLSDISAEFAGKRQVIDIPPIVPVITKHRIYRKICTCQYIPCNRMGEMLRDIFGVHISTGSLVNLVDGFAKNARKWYDIRPLREIV